MLRELGFAPGVIKDDTEYASKPYAINSNQIRWVRGRPESLGGWTTKLSGIQGYARATHEWTSIEGVPLLAIGTHTKLYVRSGDRLVDITPERDADTLGTDPIETEDGSSLVTVTHTAHAAVVGDTVYIRGVDAAVGGLTIGGLSGSLASSSFVSTLGQRIVKVLHAAHGMNDNDIAYFTGATSFAGIDAAELNAATGLRVKKLTDDTYQIEVVSLATSTSTGGGTPTYAYAKPYLILDTLAGGNSYVIDAGAEATSDDTGGGTVVAVSYDISVGPRSSRATSGGFGSSLYGRGLYGRSGTGIETAAPIVLRQWSMDHWGEQLVANISDGPIYYWQGNQSQRAIVLPNAPDRALCIVVTPERYLMACGCSDDSGDFNPLAVRHSSDEAIDVWTPAEDNNAGDFLLSAGSAVVGVLTRERGPLIWTDNALYSVRYVGLPDQIYTRDLVGTGCGLLSINAAIDRDSEIFWISSGYQFYRYSGGKPTPLECPLRTWLTKRASTLHVGKTFGWSDPLYEAISWTFVSGTAIEANEYIRLDLPEQRRDPSAGWSHGTSDRLVWSPGFVFPAKKPVAVSSAGVMYEHETGYSADGEPIDRMIEYSPAEAPPVGGEAGGHLVHFSRVVVDLENEEDLELVLRARLWPKGKVWTKVKIVKATDEKTDVRISGRQVGLEMRGATATRWRLGAIRADVSPRTLR